MSSGLSVNAALRGKSILVTGCTGFVGKVLLEKVLRDIPDVRRIFVLIRGNAQERLKSVILDSQIWARLRSERADADEFIRAKLYPLSGDVLKERLGISAADWEVVKAEVSFVIHCAATVDFREPMLVAVQNNILGALEALEVARALPLLEAHVHVSTAYVNSNKPGYHDTDLPPLHGIDPEATVQAILQMSPEDLERESPRLIGKYPNTYTFTKALTERLLEQRRGNLPSCIVRPSIIGCSWREPVPGWIDSVSAVAAMIMFSGVGLVHHMHGNSEGIADIIPVDSVVNVILAAAAATVNNRQLEVYHACSSEINPHTWGEGARWVSSYWRSHEVKRRVDHTPLKFTLYKSRTVFRTQFFLRNEVPAKLYSMASKLGSPQMKKQAALWKKINARSLDSTMTFGTFTSVEYIFSTKPTEDLVNRLIEEEQDTYNFDLEALDWEKYYRLFCYGILKFVLKEEVQEPLDLFRTCVVREPRSDLERGFLSRMFPDISWAYKNYSTNVGIDSLHTMRTPAETKHLILRSQRVQETIRNVAAAEKTTVAEIEKRAHADLDRMAHNLRLPIVRVLGWFLRKVFRRIYDGIHVDEAGLEKVRSVLTKGPILLVPTHRSYVDFLIISYIFFEYNLPMPHIASGEDFLSVLFVNWVFRNSGAFFLKRSFRGDPLYIALFTEYVQRLIVDWSPIEFFIEGRRSRTGKLLHPKFGLLSICIETLLEKKVPDLTIIPISISYEKILEADLYSKELLGESKAKESLKGLLRASQSVVSLNLGRINVICNEPISLTDFIAEKSKEENAKPRSKHYDPYANNEDRKSLLEALGYRVVYDLNKGTVITPTAILATMLLAHRKGIAHDDLLQQVNWLRNDILARGGSVAFEGGAEQLVRQTLRLLRTLLVSERNVWYAKDNKSILQLGLYRNQLLHLYTADGMVSCALASAHVRAGRETPGEMSVEQLVKDAQFLDDLLQPEFVTKPQPNQSMDFRVVINSMVERGSLEFTDAARTSVRVSEDGAAIVDFLCRLFWPYIDSYWVTALSMFSLQPKHTISRSVLLRRMQWISEKMHAEGKVHFFESCSTEVLVNALATFQAWGVVSFDQPPSALPRGREHIKDKQANEDLLVSLLPPYDTEAAVQKIVERIYGFRKPMSFATGSMGSKHAVLTEFPVLAKL
eukprot:TRINITY_DN4234_c0_g2_i1.p1 TRINITY_DN4234_c0_g2~~TRINITY_DN4234_c0_g2_i1.p1  ORF type:complete len:1163 (+),score=526.57 TRINITY_DN4234_c0_g2_i1:153-3641(+)